MESTRFAGKDEPDLETYQREYPYASARIEGADWAWRDTGAGSRRRPLVFLPGGGGTGDVFYRTVDSLRSSRRIITIRYAALADASSLSSGIVGLLATLGIENVDIAGSSLGGYLAQKIAIEKPALVRRTLFGNTFFDASWLRAKVSREALLSISPAEHLAKTVAQLTTLPEDSPSKLDFKKTMLALVGSEQTGEMAQASLAAVLGSTPLPAVTLPGESIAILDTEDDQVVDAPTRQAVRDRYHGSARFALSTGGHYPSLLNPVAYRGAIAAHFAEE